MSDNLTEGDRKRIRAIVQSIVNAKVVREVTRAFEKQKAEERQAVYIILMLFGALAIIALFIFGYG